MKRIYVHVWALELRTTLEPPLLDLLENVPM